jgi:predicted nucleotidyltransferase
MAQTSWESTRDLPADIARVLTAFVDAAREAFEDDLLSVILYGSAAEGALRPASDVNVIVVLRAFDPAKAARLRGPLQAARAAIRLVAMFLLREEIDDAARAFAQKFSDIARRRRVLFGEDSLQAVAIPRSAVVVRLNQVLLNLALRLRASSLERGQYEDQLVGLVAQTAGPLRTCAATLLELEGRAAGSPKEALQRFTEGLGEPGWDVMLARLSEARETGGLPPGVAGETVLRLIGLAGRMRERVRALG